MRWFTGRLILILTLLPALALALAVYADTYQAHAASFMVSEANFAFSPATLTVQVGDTVTWKNNDASIPHTSQSDGNWNSGNMAPGATFSFTFNTPGTYTYYCLYHRGMGMIGTIIVQGTSPTAVNTATPVPSDTPTFPPTATAISTATPLPPTATDTITVVPPTSTLTSVPTAMATITATASPTHTPTPTTVALPVQIHLVAPAIDRGQIEQVRVHTASRARLTFDARIAGENVVFQGTAVANPQGLATFSFPVQHGPTAHHTSLIELLTVHVRGVGGAQGSGIARFIVYPPLNPRVTLHTTRQRGALILWVQTTTARRGSVRVTISLPRGNVQPAAVTGISDGTHPLLLHVSLGALHSAIAMVVRVQITTPGGAGETLTKPYLVRA